MTGKADGLAFDSKHGLGKLAMNWRASQYQLAMLLCSGLTSETLVAQSGSCRLAVRVTGIDSTPLFDAEVRAAEVSARTDAAGLALFTGLQPGVQSVQVRRVGYQQFRGLVSTTCDAFPLPVDVRLGQRIQALAPVTVRADERPRFTGPMAGFWERRARGEGTFFTTVDIDKRNTQRLTDLVQSVPGWGRSQQTNRLSEALARGTAIRVGAAPRELLRTAAQRCFPTVIIDGMAVTMAELNTDGIDTRSLAGVEVYVDAARTPSEFWGTSGQGGCGVVAVWSRSTVNLKHTPLAQQAALVDTIYGAHEVDEAATLDSTANNAIAFPRSMRRTRLSGDATVSMVILPTGEIFTKSISIVRASNPEFGAALADAAAMLRFVPARLTGRTVAQRAELTVRFEHTEKP